MLRSQLVAPVTIAILLAVATTAPVAVALGFGDEQCTTKPVQEEGCGCDAMEREGDAGTGLDRARGLFEGEAEWTPENGWPDEDGSACDCSGMVEIPGGTFTMGSNHGPYAKDGEGPTRPRTVGRFMLDVTEVTNGQFAEFADATGYETDAEKFGWSFVFEGLLSEADKARDDLAAVASAPWWVQIPGASWRYPYGPSAGVDTVTNVTLRDGFPATHISWNDARAYCRWRRKRLPTEGEWERAARGGLEGARFPWGDELYGAGGEGDLASHRANIWQGTFPDEDTGADGHVGPGPVTSYQPNAYGLYNMIGNVWEWTHDWFSAIHDLELVDDADVQEDLDFVPSGRRVQKGGSFLCHASYCYRYRNAARVGNEPDSSSLNSGFRCAGRVMTPDGDNEA